jgi:ABC-2 type transport system permease protein
MKPAARGVFRVALWAELLKARRAKLPWLTALGFTLAPLVGGLFMIILKDPERAQDMGLISAKAQLTAGVADWPTYFGLLAQATSVAGAVLFSLLTAWVFGREFSDHTAKELLATPTPRSAIVAAKFVVIAIWTVSMVGVIFIIGLIVGNAVGLPGWSNALLGQSVMTIAQTALLALALMPPVALLASAGRGYLPAMGWMFLTIFLAQIIAATGWGGWFPWSVPPLFSGLAGPRAEQVGAHSYVLVGLVLLGGLAATFAWWRSADQTR